MKKITLITLAAIAIALSLTSCYAAKEYSKQFTYEDPQTIGGLWTVSFPNGEKYEHVSCSYWGTDDDTSVWILEDGRKLIQSGTVWASQE